MASIVPRPQKSGEITYQVKWRQDGRWQTENFGGSPESETHAEQFKAIVEAHGNKWPPGWVKGLGFVEEEAAPGDVPLLEYATRYVDRLTGIDDRTRADYHREIRLHLALLQHTTAQGLAVPATVCNVTKDDVADWVRIEERGVKDPDDPKKWLVRKADPKSIRNRHGLLFCIMQAAIDGEPQLRTANPCKGTKLPRVDDHTEEEMTFLEREEYQRVRREIKDPAAADLADWLVGTGCRWGEATALQVRDISLAGSAPTASITRAWKKAPAGSDATFFLGPPKTKKARRVLDLTPDQADMMRRLITGMPPEAFVFRTATGKAWRHANYYNRKWKPAVAAAVAKGLPKRPRIHDLRHTHVSWLIGARIPLPAIQLRLGHESIQTTVDRYGHLVRELGAEITAAVAAAMAAPAPEVEAGGLRVVV